MTTETLDKVLSILQEEANGWDVPIVTLVAERSSDPFQVLVSTLLSLRTKDETTTVASRRLFAKAKTPEEMLELPVSEIRELIFPVGFYKRKAENLHTVSRLLIEKYDGKVPDALDLLLGLPGVGRKTANLVLTLGYSKAGICVDTHVHRISNRFGYVETKSPDDTEFALRDKLPAKWWIAINDILVAFGQSLCHPTSPWCSKCKVYQWCERVGVTRSR